VKSALLASSASIILLVLLCSSAFAVLGQDVSTIQVDGARMKASTQITPGMAYSVHELRALTGTTVREFVSPAGEVFGVAWQGPYTPNLRELLGDYFDDYMRIAENPERVHRRALHIENGDLVFESGGHMRFLVGRAYLRSKLPDGVSANDIH
jgi:hypothetical protein